MVSVSRKFRNRGIILLGLETSLRFFLSRFAEGFLLDSGIKEGNSLRSSEEGV